MAYLSNPFSSATDPIRESERCPRISNPNVTQAGATFHNSSPRSTPAGPRRRTVAVPR